MPRSPARTIARLVSRRRRGHPSPAHRLLWNQLKGGGRDSGRPRWKRQVPLPGSAGSIADFFCPAARLAVFLLAPSSSTPPLPRSGAAVLLDPRPVANPAIAQARALDLDRIASERTLRIRERGTIGGVSPLLPDYPLHCSSHGTLS